MQYLTKQNKSGLLQWGYVPIFFINFQFLFIYVISSEYRMNNKVILGQSVHTGASQ